MKVRFATIPSHAVTADHCYIAKCGRFDSVMVSKEDSREILYSDGNERLSTGLGWFGKATEFLKFATFRNRLKRGHKARQSIELENAEVETSYDKFCSRQWYEILSEEKMGIHTIDGVLDYFRLRWHRTEGVRGRVFTLTANSTWCH